MTSLSIHVYAKDKQESSMEDISSIVSKSIGKEQFKKQFLKLVDHGKEHVLKAIEWVGYYSGLGGLIASLGFHQRARIH
jgi:hypothetical protein